MKLRQNQWVKAGTEFWLLNLGKIERLLFYCFLLFLPTQFGKHFWPNFSFVVGQRIDYLSPTLYVTDILVVLLFLFSLKKIIPIHISKKTILFSFVILFLSVSIFLSQSPMAGWYFLLKFLEMSFVVWYTMSFLRKQESSPGSRIKSGMTVIGILFSITIIFESFLAFAQFFHQGSLGGIFYFLGERTFSASTPGIANAAINGQLILRPYGTFSHPNVLAGYLLISMLLVIYFYFSKNQNVIPAKAGIQKSSGSRIKSGMTMQTIFFSLSLLTGSLGIFVSLSRTAILAWFLCLLIFFIFYFKNKTKQLFLGMVVFLTYLLLSFFIFPDIIYRFFFSLSDESVVERIALSKAALQIIFARPVFGVGLGNFIPSLPSLGTSILQPVHNIYLLVAAETGIPGLFFFLCFLFYVFRKISSLPLFLAFCSILFIGLFDHYWLTLQQGQLLFAVVIGIVIGIDKTN